MAPFRRVAVRVALLALAAMIAAVAPARGAAADEGWTIQRFHADIVIQHDGSLLITETVDAAFGTAKHGIYRDIPVRYALNGNTDRIYDLRVRSVTDAAGAPWHYQQSRQGRDVRLTIGDASRLVTGAQTYVITYEIRGALNGFADHDELYWNVNGGNWPVPAQEVSATVRLDGGGLGRA